MNPQPILSTSLKIWCGRSLKLGLLLVSAFVTLQTQAVNLTPLPPYLSEIKGAPMVMLNLSRDHQLFFKAYNEYSDLDGDGVLDTQYKHSYKYYGYFDNQRCYQYNTTNNRYVPTRKIADDGYCNYAGGSSEWSGNFLNWGTMTRMDVVRRILYGGQRSTDDSIVSGTSLTVLERAHLPTDAHAFAKYYAGSDVSKLTPFNKPEITLCNASFKNDKYSHQNISAPSIFVADGNFSLWNANERWQCYWSEDKSASNGNNPALTGLAASSSNPSRSSKGLGTGYAQGSYRARVEVCKTGLDDNFTEDEKSRCKLYPLGNYKPVGLLQRYGERNEAAFGLMTGSFNKNISGGVLRKNVASFTDEVDIDDGQFKNVDGIVRTLNRLRIYGYNYDDGSYLDDGAGCNYQTIGLTDGQCASWGNPMGEQYLEALRYLAGKSASTEFTTSGGKDAALGLSIVAWSDPFATSTTAAFGDRLCRRTSIVNFNASVTSYDSDQWAGASDINDLTVAKVDDYTNQIGNAEGLYATGKKWAVGRNGVDNNAFCSDKTLTATGTTSLANATGICPEAPTQFGGYKMAGAALYAHTTPIREPTVIPSNNKRAFRVDTYGVALATGTPRIRIAVPGLPGKFVFISPAYRLSKGTGGGGTLVDFKVITQTATAGKFLINWEDSEQGGDFDQDVLGILEYSVSGTTLSVKTYAAAEATNTGQGFGYAVSGTVGKDGVHFHSGIEGFNFTDPRNITVTPNTNVNASGGCNNCQVAQAPSTATYTMAGVTEDTLKDPLWYASKYGGFNREVVPAYTLGNVLPTIAWDAKGSDGTTGADGTPDNFFYAIDPAQLEKSLEQVFAAILKAGGAAPAAASANTQAGGYVYTSTYSIKSSTSVADADASSEFFRYSFQSNGAISSVSDWDAGAKLTVKNWDTGRKIFTLASGGGKTFRWTNLDTAQQTSLRTNPGNGTTQTVAIGQNRLNWLRGDNTNETSTGGLRARPKTKLGAIINSTPWYVGAPAAGYTNAAYGGGYGTYRSTNAATNAVFVAANDGMLHAFNGATGDELFAYIPRALYATTSTAPFSKLSAITAKDFALNVGTSSVNMDGSVMAADMKVGGNWATYLFGSFGRGGKGVYALNVTKPQTLVEDAASATQLAKWEFSDATGDPDMGYIIGRPTERRNGQPFQTGYMANGKWAAIYGNGYNSTSGKAALFILFADGPANAGTSTWTSGTQYIKIPTGTAGDGPDNGLAMATAIDTDNDGAINIIYAGDLKGNVWKFDVSSTNPANWKVATTGNVPLYQARTTITSTATVIAQPITTTVQPFPHPNGGYQLIFGTGKSLESTDYPMSVSYANTIYGIYDRPGNTGTLTTGLADLVQKGVTDDGIYRYVQSNSVNYVEKKGWYLNLPIPSEGLIFNPVTDDANRVFLKTLAPRGFSDGCSVESQSATLDLNPISGSPVPYAVDNAPAVNGYSAAGQISNNNFDVGKAGIYAKPIPPSSTGSCVAGSSVNCVCNPAMPTQCELCADPNNCKKSWDPPPQANQCVFRKAVVSGSGALTAENRFGSCNDGRLTWREIVRNR